MRLDRYMETVTATLPRDWLMIAGPTLRHRFTALLDTDGQLVRQAIDEPLAAFSYRPDIRLTLLFGLVDSASYRLPPERPFAQENARTVLLHCLYGGEVVYTETLLKADRQRCILPLPAAWSVSAPATPEAAAAPAGARHPRPGVAPVEIPRRQHDLARLVHQLAGPLTDFDHYFRQAGMVVADTPWP